jgi:hypothetical protein
MDGSGGVKIKKSILPHPILRDLHSEIELLLTNCRKSEATRKSGKKSSAENLIDVGEEKCDLIVTDSDSNLPSFCSALEKAFRQMLLNKFQIFVRDSNIK